MSDNEMAIVVLSIIFGSIVAIVAISKIFGVLKAWIERNKSTYDEEQFDRLARAFIQHKKEMDRRVQNLEAIVTDEEPKSLSDSPSGSSVASSPGRQPGTSRHNTIEVDTGEASSSKKEEKESEGGSLRNMLKE